MKKIIERQFPKDEAEDDSMTEREWLWERSREAVEEFDRENSKSRQPRAIRTRD